jgi:hypothetical protein
MSMMKEILGYMQRNNRTHTTALATALAFLILFSLLMEMSALAADSQPQKGTQGSYGEKQKITTAGEARKALEKHFANKDVIIGEVVEKELYFEADIMDKKQAVIDKVIVDKRTGRVRSIY